MEKDTKGEKTEVVSAPDFSSETYEEDFEFGKSGYDVDRTNGGTSWFSYYNIVCLVAGTGMLGLSSALKQGGWASLLMVLLSWWMSSYTAVIMQSCMYCGKDRRLSSYKEIATAAFGTIGGWVSFFFSTWIYVGTPILYLVLAGTNLDQLTENTVADIGAIYWTIIWCFVVGIPFIFLKSLNDVAWTSAVGTAAITGTIMITLVMTGIDSPNQTTSVHQNVIWDGFPIALATISFSFGGNVVYPNMEASMKNPKRWPHVIVGGLSTCAIMYLAIAVAGYYVYGESVINPVYNSIPVGIPRTIAVALVTVNVILSAPILLVGFALDCEDMMNITVERHGKVKEFIFRSLFRIALMVFVAIVGIFIPFFDLLMSLIGAFANCAVIFIFPVLFYLRLTGFKNKPLWIHAWHALIILVGLVGLIFGTWSAIEHLIDRFSDGYEYSL